MKVLFFLILFLFLELLSYADNLNTQQIGNSTYTNGTVNGQPYHTTTQRIGGFEYTNGNVGNDSYHTTTQQIGGFDYTNGNLGGFGLMN